MKSAVVLFQIFAIIFAQSLEIEDCQEVQNKTQVECANVSFPCLDSFGINVTWVEKVNEQGVCQQRDQYCGYVTAHPCKRDPQCVWNKTEESCFTVDPELQAPPPLEENQPSSVIISNDISASVQSGFQISYVPMPNPRRPSMVALSVDGIHVQTSLLRSVAFSMTSFYNRMSRGKIRMSAFIGVAKAPAGRFADQARLFYRPGASSRVPVIGNAASAKHELGHQLGFGHAQVRIWGTQVQVVRSKNESDPFDPMTVRPDVNSLNAPHLHFKGWFTETEEAYAQVGGEYVLNLINAASTDPSSLKALYYQVPGTNRMLWFSYVRLDGKTSVLTAPTDMPGTAIAVHANDNSNSVGVVTWLEGLLGQKPVTNIRSGLIIQVSNPTPYTVTVKIAKDPKWVLMGH